MCSVSNWEHCKSLLKKKKLKNLNVTSEYIMSILLFKM